MDQQKRLVVVGGGMVAHRLVEAMRDRDVDDTWRIDVFTEESRPPYDRVALTTFFSGRDPEDLLLGEPGLWRQAAVRLHTNSPVKKIDTEARQVHARGRVYDYDALVMATGSSAFVPPVEGADLPGSFVYRTVDDVAELRAWVEHREREHDRPVRGAVVGGGLLGLEAAGALQAMGVETTVVEFAPRLMALQVDDGGGEGLRRLIEKLGISVRTSTATSRVKAGRHGRVGRMEFSTGEKLPVDVVVFATGVRPRDELARDAGLAVGERGGVVVDDRCATAVPDVYAVGEVACIQGRTWGLVGPGNTMAEVVVDRLLGGAATFPGADTSTKLKLLGVDVASFGDVFAAQPGSLEVVYADPVAGVYKKLVLSDDAQTLLGGVLVGDATAYASLRLRPDGLAAARGQRAGARRGPPRRRRRLLLQQRLGGRDPVRGDRAGLHRPRRREGVHQGRHVLRLLPAAGQEADDDRAGEVRRRGQQRALRALRRQPGAAVRHRPGHRAADLQRDHRRARPRSRLRHLPPGHRLDPVLAGCGPRARHGPGAAPGHQRPRDGQPAEGRDLLRRTPHPRR